jgi:hypothetical protein
MASQPAALPPDKAARRTLTPAQEALIGSKRLQITIGPAQSPAPRKRARTMQQEEEGPPAEHERRHAGYSSGPVAQALTGLLEKQLAQQKAKHAVLEAFAKALDSQTALFTDPEQRAYAQELAPHFIGVIQREIGSRPTISLDTPPASPTTEKPTWAAVAAKKPSRQAPPKPAPAKQANLKPANPAGFSSQPENRVLVRLAPESPTRNAALFAVRTTVQEALGLKTGDIISAQAIPTGVALRPRNQEIRDRIVTEQAKVCTALQATKVELPQKWYSYAVQGCPKRISTLAGEWVDTQPLIHKEVLAQTGIKPVECRISRHQSDSPTATWIISFLQPVESHFRLFDSSDSARLITKKTPLMQCEKCWDFHDTRGCKRRPVCKDCAQLAHGGPCKEPTRCTLCRGPHTAIDLNCPVRPVRRDGVYARLNRAQRGAARQMGDRAFQAFHQQPPNAQDNDGSTIHVATHTSEDDNMADITNSPTASSSPTTGLGLGHAANFKPTKPYGLLKPKGVTTKGR